MGNIGPMKAMKVKKKKNKNGKNELWHTHTHKIASNKNNSVLRKKKILYFLAFRTTDVFVLYLFLIFFFFFFTFGVNTTY